MTIEGEGKREKEREKKVERKVGVDRSRARGQV